MNPLLQDLVNIYWDAVREADPASLLLSRLKMDGRTLLIDGCGITIAEDLSHYKKVVVIGAGKASARMASSMELLLGNELSGGFVITKYGHKVDTEKIRVMEAGHPLPDENSVEGARFLARLAAQAGSDTLIINLISGGGSALFCLPADKISLADKIDTTRYLLASGATIAEMNCIRKHLSKVKGGGLAKMAHPARLISLILSDVAGDRIDTIASGITAPDSTTFKDALCILRKYSLDDKLPAAVAEHLRNGAQGLIPETPKAGDPVFGDIANIILGNNALACAAALRCARQLGYNARILSTDIEGEASGAGVYFARLAKEIATRGSGSAGKSLIITGGEATVTIRGKGRGGRNQEMALAFACELNRIHPCAQNIFFLSAGTDGCDGPTDAAGAFVTPELMKKMKEIEAAAFLHLEENDSYHFFENAGLLFKTGPTYTNVCDIQILAVV